MGTTRNEVSTNTDYKNDDECSSDTMTSEPSRDSSMFPDYLKQHSLSVESSSNSQLNISKDLTTISQPWVTVQHGASINNKSTNEAQLREILKKLPPVQSISAIEARYAEEIIPCTCKISEIFPMNNANALGNGQNICEINNAQQTEIEHCMKVHITSSNSFYDETVEKQQIYLMSTLLNQAKPKKSIFDFDFDEDEDPLDSLKAESTTAAYLKANKETNIKKLTQSEIDANALHFRPIERKEKTDKITATASAMTHEVSPIYKLEDDPLCLAKQRFDQESRTITNLHLDAFHNLLVSNVNGNWDVRLQGEFKTELDVDKNYKATLDVVPKYSFLANLPSFFKTKLDREPQKRQSSKEPLFGNETINNTICMSLSNLLTKIDATTICNVNNLSLSTNIDGHRSTLSTLNQPKSPLNPKLKRTFQGNIVDINAEKRRRPNKGQRSFNTKAKCDKTIQPNDKRNEVVINSSGKISYEEMRKQLKDLCVSNDCDVHNLIMNKVDGDIETKKKANTTASQIEQASLACGGIGLASNLSEHDLPYSSRGVCEGNGNEDGDFHEVCAKDISVPLKNGNHVLLTIQKTPSQPPSLSKSHIAPSSISSNDNMTSSPSDIDISSTTIKTSNFFGYKNKQATFQSNVQLSPLEQTIFSFDSPSGGKSPHKIGLTNRSRLGDAIEGINVVLPKNIASIEHIASNEISNPKSEFINPEETAMSSRGMKHHRQLFFPHEICLQDNDGTKRSILNISSCSSSCTELSDQECSNDSFMAVVCCEPKTNTQARIECRTRLNEACDRYRSGSLVDMWKHLRSRRNHNNEESTGVINECAANQKTLPITNNESNVKDTHMLASIIDNTRNCKRNRLPLRNKFLLETPNDIYFSVNEVYPSRNCISQRNDKIFDNMVCSVDDSNCFDNESSLVKSVNRYSATNDDIINNICRTPVKHKNDDSYDYNCNFYNDKTSDEPKIVQSHKGEKPRALKDSKGNCARFQLFREWHQVLQLRSYNDELLTVLPYVVFD